MPTSCGQRIQFEHVLFLTDFSEPSSDVLPVVAGIARAYGSVVHVLHALIPSAQTDIAPRITRAMLDAEEELAKMEMERVDAQMMGLPHDTTIERGPSVWEVACTQLKKHPVNLVVLGTHGRTGFRKAFMGSAAEEVFRRATVPVVVQGRLARAAAHHGGRFRCVLFATDFKAVSAVATPYAVSLAQENQARLILFHVLPQPKVRKKADSQDFSVAETLHNLGQLLPSDAQLWCRPQPCVAHGAPAHQIVATARRESADLIVLGIRGVGVLREMQVRVQNNVAYDVIAHAPCPVLTVRGLLRERGRT